jgi:hypothetical protein
MAAHHNRTNLCSIPAENDDFAELIQFPNHVSKLINGHSANVVSLSLTVALGSQFQAGFAVP